MKNLSRTIEFLQQDLVLDLRHQTQTVSYFTYNFKLTALILVITIIFPFSVFSAQANSTPTQNNQTQSASTPPPQAVNNVKMTARVSGWYKTEETSNERLDITTNMQVYINGYKFENCADLKTANNNGLRF